MMDADRKEFTFNNWYKTIYKIRDGHRLTLNDIFDFDNTKKFGGNNMLCLRTATEIKNNKYISCEKKDKIEKLIKASDKLVSNGFYPFRLSGDADYELITDKKKDKRMHYVLNFSLIPVTGGVNNRKNRTPLRKFIGVIDQYYENRSIKSLPIGCRGRKYKDPDRQKKKEDYENQALKAYFDIFDDIEEYCKVVYLMGKDDIQNSQIGEYWDKRKAIAIDNNIAPATLCIDVSENRFE